MAVIRIGPTGATVRRGRLHATARMFVADILREAGVCCGYITILSGGRLEFSPSIPKAIRRRLSNVLLHCAV